MKGRLLILLLLCATAALGARRDFLTADEADQVRLTQEPNARLMLYLKFARQRADMLQQMLQKEKPGRSALIHEILEDYTKIIEAIDTVADDALKRGLEIGEGMGAVAKQEKELLEILRRVEENEPKDMARYRFVLTTAIETTEDSLELAELDLQERKADVAAREQRERKQREELMTPEDVEERKEAAKKTAEREAEQKRKIPTLRRKGEAPPPKK